MASTNKVNATLKVEIEVDATKLEAYHAKVEGGFSPLEAAVTTVVGAVHGPAGFVDTVPNRRALLAGDILQQVLTAAGLKPAAAKKEAKEGAAAEGGAK